MAGPLLRGSKLRTQFLNRLEELLEKEFTIEKLFPILDRLESEIAAEATLDRSKWGYAPNYRRGGGEAGAADYPAGIAQVKNFIEQRRAFLLREIKTLR